MFVSCMFDTFYISQIKLFESFVNHSTRYIIEILFVTMLKTPIRGNHRKHAMLELINICEIFLLLSVGCMDYGFILNCLFNV